MADVFIYRPNIKTEQGFVDRWVPLEQDVSSFLGDPARTGNVYLHDPTKSILDEVTDRTSREQWDAFHNACRIFATNYGLSRFFAPGTTHILPQGNERGYILLQLTDSIVDLSRWPVERTVKIDINPMKMFSVGFKYRVDGTPEEIMECLRQDYRFIGPSEGQGPLSWFMDVRSGLEEQRRLRITDEFVIHVNEEYHNQMGRSRPTTKQEMLKELGGSLYL